MTAPRFISARDLARRWAVSPAYVSEAIRRGDIPANRFGRAVRIRIDDVERIERESFVTPQRIRESEVA